MQQRMTAKEYSLLINNKKVRLDGYTFDSQLEADYYAQLKLREEVKDILFFRVQPRYLLQHAFEKGEKKFSKIEYIADFEIHHKDGSIEVVDIKNFITDVFRIKEKLFHMKYPHKLTVFTKDDF